jgi:hypothetical protein
VREQPEAPILARSIRTGEYAGVRRLQLRREMRAKSLVIALFPIFALLDAENDGYNNADACEV